MPVRITSEKSFLRIENTITNGVVFVNKANVLIQKDSDTNFSVKSDTFVGYFKYSDIETPTSTSIDDLITTLVSWADTQQEEVITNAENIVNVRNNLEASSTSELTELTEAGGTSSFVASRGLYEMSTITEVGSRVVRQTRKYVPDSFATNVFVLAEAVLGSGTTGGPTDVTTRIGIFEDVNDLTVGSTEGGRGAFFSHDASSNDLSIVLRKNDGSGSQVDTSVSQANWNVDKLDGSGLSKYTLDPNVLNVFVFKWNPLSKALNLGVLAGENIYYCHKIDGGGSGGEDVQLMNVPMRWEIIHDGDTAPTDSYSMKQGRVMIFSDDDSSIRMKTVDSGTTPKTVNDSSVPMLSVRLKDIANRTKVFPQSLSVVNVASSGVAKWELVTNASLTGETFQDVTDSFTQLSTTETDATGGTVVASGFIVNSGASTFDLSKKEIFLTSDIQGVSETMTLRIVHVSGTVEVLSTLDWLEKE